MADLKKKADRAFGFAARQLHRLIETHPDYFPMYTAHGRWKHSGEAWTNWCEGFLGGQLWLLYERTRRRLLAGQSEHYSRLIEHRKTDRNVHDLGFLFWLHLEALVRPDRRSRAQTGRDRSRADDGAALPREGPVPALVCRGRQPLHRHHDERRHHLLRRAADRRRGPAPQGDGALPDDAQVSRPRRRQHIARGDLRHGTPANSSGRPPTRDGATTPPGRAGWPGRCTVSERPTTSPTTNASCRRRRLARIITSNAHPRTASRPTIGTNRTPHCLTRAPPPRSPPAEC